MCFSATSSFIMAGSLFFTTVLALHKAQHKKLIPLCLMPLGFAIQQAAEGVVWLTITTPNNMLHRVSIYTFLSFAFIIWPLWIPFAIKVYESHETKKMLLSLCQLLGLLFALTAAFFLFAAKPLVVVEGGNLAYYFPHNFFAGKSSLAWYLIPTVLPFLLIGSRIIGTALGSFALVSLAVTYFVTPAGLISVWCYLAAVMSLMILGLVWQESNRG
ncbi:MAG: DUF6629 family protein [Candidatus Babeliales bacterium]